MMSRMPWRAASQCVTGKRNPCARWKCLMVKLLFRKVVLRLWFLFTTLSGHKRKFLVCPFSLLGFLVFIVIYFFVL